MGPRPILARQELVTKGFILAKNSIVLLSERYTWICGMSADTTSYTDVVDRRRFLKLAGVSGAAALAGCAGDSEPTDTEEPPTDDGTNGTDTATPTGGVEVHDVAFLNSGQDVPTDTHFNRANNQTYSWNAAWNIHERYAAWNFARNEFELAALEEWEIDGTTVTLTIRDDLTWENGEDVTTDDVEVQLRILEKIGSTVWDFTEDFSVVDEKTVELQLDRESNPNIVRFAIANLRMGYPASVFEEYVDQDAAQVQQFQWHDPIGNGPFSLDTKNAQEFRFTRNDEYYNAQNVNFSTYRLLYRDGNTAIQQGLRSGELEGSTSLFVPAETVETFPDSVEEINVPAKWGYGMLFNHDDDVFGRREVRQAIAHVVNRQSLVDNAGPNTKFPAEVPCGIAPRDQDPWLGDRMSDFESYGVDSSQTDAAATLMNEAGFERNNGTWQDENGNAISAQYLSPAGWTDFTVMSNTVVDQLNNFGFDLSVSTQPASDWETRFSNSNFRIGTFYWLPGGARSSFPYFPLRHQLVNNAINGGHNWPEGERTIPAFEGDGTMTINPIETVQTIATTADEEETQNLVQQAAWHNNHDLPMLSLVSKWEQSWMTDNEKWDIVGEDHEDRQVKWPPHWLPRKGSMTATGN